MYAAAIAANILLASFVAWGAIMRYIAGSPFHFTEELVGLLFLTSVALALPEATRRRQHIAVTLVPDVMHGAMRTWAGLAARLVTLVFTGWFLWLAADAGFDAYRRGLVTEQSGMPAWLAYAVLSVSAFGIVLVIAPRLVRDSDDDAAATEAPRSVE